MKKIICYGDSNTFGYNPGAESIRFDENTRWTGILQKNSGDDFEIINEGVCDRTGFVDNPKGTLFSAQKHFPSFIVQSSQIDILILALGTNDLQFQYNIDFVTVEKGLKNLINLAQQKAKKIIIIPPVILNENVLKGFFNFQFDKTSIDKSKKIGAIYKKSANDYHCAYFDINEFTTPSDVDGLHYDKNSHKLIADKLTDFINQN